jgi:hypothetical protein
MVSHFIIACEWQCCTLFWPVHCVGDILSPLPPPASMVSVYCVAVGPVWVTLPYQQNWLHARSELREAFIVACTMYL